MQFHLNSREEVEHFIKNEVLTSSETQEVLEISRARLNKMVTDGKLNPVKKLPGISLFLRRDVEEKKKELGALRKKYRPYDD